MRNLRFVYIALCFVILVTLTSCGLSPCDCAHAQLNNDTKTLKKCEEKVGAMSKEESIKWYKEESECIQTQ